MRRLFFMMATAVVVCHAVLAEPPVKLASHQSWVPQASVPRLTEPPVIDGVVGDDEWSAATAFTGLTPSCTPYNPYVQPEPMQGIVFLAHDGQNLLVGLRSPIPPPPKNSKERLKSGGKGDDDAGGIESGDYWEVRFQIPNEKKESIEYLFKVNPAGKLSDQRVTPQDEGKNRHAAGIEWSAGAKVAAKTDEERNLWEVELAIPFAALGFADGAPIGKSWRTMFLRGHGYCGPTRGEWNGAVSQFMGDQAGIIVISGELPAFQLLRLGELRDYKLAPAIRLTNRGTASRDTEVRISVESGDAVLHEEKKRITLAPGESVRPEWSATTFEPPPGMSARVRVEAFSGADLLYMGEAQTIRMAPREYKSYAHWPYGSWPFESACAGKWELKASFYPYFNAVDASVNTALDYLPADMHAAPRCALSLSLLDAAGRAAAPLKSGTIALKEGKGSLVWREVDLRPGVYTVSGQLMNDKDEPIGGTITRQFERRAFPWERNSIGVSDNVFEPFREIKVDRAAGTLSPWGRIYTLGRCGLPGGIVTTAEARLPEQTVCGPLRIEATVDGVMKPLDGGSVISSTEPGIVRLKGTGEAAGLKMETRAFMQYDGWWQTSVKFVPTGTTHIDRLELVIPLAKEADTMWFYRGRSEIFSGGLRKGAGELWNNLKKNGKTIDNVFTPVIGVGTGDAALWWFADGDNGWRLDYCKPSQSITREADGSLSLRMAFVNAPAALDKPVELSFAVNSNPFRPDPPRRRLLQWGGSGRIHDTSGYGYWGTGVDSITPGSDEAFTRLKDGIAQWAEKVKTAQRTAIEKWAGEGVSIPHPIVLYNSGELIGPSMPEYATFSGEWGGPAPEDIIPEYKDSDRHSRINFNGVQQDWRSRPLSLGPAFADLTQSVVDCRVWHYKQNMEKLGVSGYWFDNASVWPGTNVVTGRAYATASGAVRPLYPVFARRDLFRRLFILYKEAGREPWYLINTHTSFEFAAWRWSIESDSYVYNYGGDLFDTLERQQRYDIDSRVIEVDAEVGDPVARFRGHNCLRRVPGAMVSNLHPRDPSGVHGSRSVIGLSLAHDFGVESGVNAEELDRIRRILREFGAFENDAITFIPYWRKDTPLAFSDKRMLTSVYVNNANKKALVVLVNPLKEKVEGALTINAGKLGLHDALAAAEPESGRQLECRHADADALQVDVDAPAREYRLVLLRPPDEKNQ